LAFRDVIHKAATFTVLGEGGQKASYHGVVTEFRQLQEIGEEAVYRVRIEPWLSNARVQVQSEGYLDKTVPAIIDATFRDSGLNARDYQVKLTGDINSKTYEYLCQYEESDLNFLQALLEQEGAYYYFEDDGNAEKVVFLNDKNSQPTSTRDLRYQ